jgi:hypothetical protein
MIVFRLDRGRGRADCEPDVSSEPSFAIEESMTRRRAVWTNECSRTVRSSFSGPNLHTVGASLSPVSTPVTIATSALLSLRELLACVRSISRPHDLGEPCRTREHRVACSACGGFSHVDVL